MHLLLDIFHGDERGVVEELAYLRGKDERAGHHFAGGAVGYNFAVAQEDHAVGQVRGKLYIVGGEYDRFAFVAQGSQDVRQRRLLQVVEAPGRLVEHKEWWVAGQHRRDSHALALTDAEVAGVGQYGRG